MSVIGNDAGMKGPKFTWFVNTAGVGEHTNLVHHVTHIVFDTNRLERRVKTFLQARVMGSDAGRAGVLVAMQGLDAAKCKHETACRGNEVGADA